MWRTILAIESTASACSAAIWHEGVIAAHATRVMDRGHAATLMPLVLDALRAAGTGFSRLDGVAVTVGPGAFTGIRIGLATARGIALAARIPVRGFTAFAVNAEAVPPAERRGRYVLVLIDSLRGDVFAQLFAPGLDPVGPARTLSVSTILESLPRAPVLLTGDGVVKVRPRFDAATTGALTAIASNCGPPDARHLARLAARTDRSSYILPPVPVYLRNPAVFLNGRTDVAPDQIVRRESPSWAS